MEILIAIISILFSGIIATCISIRHYNKMQFRIERKGLLSEIFEWKNGMVALPGSEPRIKVTNLINKIPIIFHDNPDVNNRLKDYYNSLDKKDELECNMCFNKLIISMAEDKYIKIKNLDLLEDYIFKTFS